jgi:glycyl-tRNA synthetase beta chain
MADFLLELRCEEIPARMQAGARAELEKLFRKQLAADGISAEDLTIWSTPRRLALIARGLPLETEATSVEVKGPRVGAPDQAINGFLGRYLANREELVDRNGVYFLERLAAGRPISRVLQEAVETLVRDFSWPKSMRWGDASISTDSLRWVRPLSGIVALLDGDILECDVPGVPVGRETSGHRFHHSGPISIDSADDYAAKLRAAHVIVDHEERQNIIREGAAKVAAEAGLTLVADEGLVIENAGLTEWPVPLLGRFDESFLDVPPEVIQLTARVNQKYFVCQSSPSGEKDRDPQGRGGGADAARPSTILADGPPPPAGEDKLAPKLANAFVCTANIEPREASVVVDGNRKVLAARLSDARFFWEQDQKTPLAVHAEKLARITFHEKLGTVADKVERVAKLARWLCEEGIILPETGRGTTPDLIRGGGGATGAAPIDKLSDRGGSPLHHPAAKALDGPPPLAGEDRARLADLAEQAARLCKADLVTEMVGEFPELQGLMGGYYAAKEGLPVEVSDAIRDHYKPVGQGDDVPTAPVTVAVSLADKLDTLLSFFSINEKPTGSKDPFALRRSAISVISLVNENGSRGLAAAVKSFSSSRAEEVNAAFPPMREAVQKRQSEELASIHIVEDAPDYREQIGRREQLWQDHRNELDLLNEGFTKDWNSALAYGDAFDLVFEFLVDRLKVQQREAGVRHDLIDAVFALGGEDDLVRLLARVHALQAFVTTEDGTNLLAGYKRAANILKKEGYAAAGEGALALSYTPEEAEKALIDALDSAAPLAAQAVSEERFADAMAALATLRAPIDRFFEEVTVNAPEADKRSARLALLARFRDAVHQVADFSRIEG